MLVAVTGAAGFVGTYTVAALQRLGHRVRGLEAPHARPERLKPVLDEWRIGDQYDARVQREFVADTEALIHIGIDWEALNQSPRANLKRNLLGTLRLLETAREAGVGQFVFVSSLEVYGPGAPDQPRVLSEADACSPSSVYGAFKAAVEPHIQAYHATYGLNGSSWRPAAIYGMNPRQDRSMWRDMVDQVRQDQIPHQDSAAHVVNVQDVAETLALSIGDMSTAGQIFNLVDYHVTWRAVAQHVAELLGRHTGALRAVNGPEWHPRQNFDNRKAIRFLDAHGEAQGLRRGITGVREYLAQLIAVT
jgi:nucleoside-diphosphate-sugar epimerase